MTFVLRWGHKHWRLINLCLCESLLCWWVFVKQKLSNKINLWARNAFMYIRARLKLGRERRVLSCILQDSCWCEIYPPKKHVFSHPFWLIDTDRLQRTLCEGCLLCGLFLPNPTVFRRRDPAMRLPNCKGVKKDAAQWITFRVQWGSVLHFSFGHVFWTRDWVGHVDSRSAFPYWRIWYMYIYIYIYISYMR